EVQFHHLRPEGEAGIRIGAQEASFLQRLEVAVKRRPAVAQPLHQFLRSPFELFFRKDLQDSEAPFKAVSRLLFAQVAAFFVSPRARKAFIARSAIPPPAPMISV